MTKARFPLYLQTLGMLVLYLSTLAAIIFACFNAQFGIGWEAALKSPLGERFETMAGAISSQLHATKPADWPEIIKTFEGIYHVKLCVFDIAGMQLAGDKINLPSGVSARIMMPPLPPPPDEKPLVVFRPSQSQPPVDEDTIHYTSHDRGPFPMPDDDIEEVSPPIQKPLPQSESKPTIMIPSDPEGLTPPSGKFIVPGPLWHKYFKLPDDKTVATDGLGRFHFPAADKVGLFLTSRRPGMHFGHHLQPPSSAFMRARDRFLVHTTAPDRFWICAHIFVFNPRLGFYVPGVLIAVCDNLWQSRLLIDLKMVVEFLAVVLALSLAFWWPFIYRITSALSRLTKATESIAHGKFDTRVNVRGGDEIGRLSEAVDTMATQLEGYVQGQKQLLADISHELFTPLARQQLALELLDQESTETQKGLITDIREEVVEMNNLISELIAYSKAGMQAKTTDLVPLNLKLVVEALVPKLINANNITLDLPEDITVLADRLLLERAISNVLRNSVRYAGQDGQITVSAARDGEAVLVTISDNGPGVSEAALKHLGQPFYRPEASRNRASGGFGLGLAIVKSCVESCQGSLTIRNASGGGMTVEMRLKAARV